MAAAGPEKLDVNGAYDGFGHFCSIGGIAQLAFLMGIGQIPQFDQNRRHVRCFKNGKAGKSVGVALQARFASDLANQIRGEQR